MPETIVRPAQANDEKQWRNLWAGYIKFYRAEVSEEITANTWKSILDPASKINALVAEKEGKIIGLCNYLFHDST